jgi:hypothetical protein
MGFHAMPEKMVAKVSKPDCEMRYVFGDAARNHVPRST